MPDAAEVTRICRIARDHRAPGAPALRDLIDAAQYRAVRPRLTAATVKSCIDADPRLIDDWLGFSEDKRTAGGWAFQRQTPFGWKVWQPFPEGAGPAPRRFARAGTACAEYILAELDYWAADVTPVNRGTGDA
jgi:hypothetical protein